MPARTHTRFHHPSAPPVAQVRLPWWAIALPSIAFAALLLLILGSSDAHAASGSTSAVARLLHQFLESVFRGAS